MIEILLKASGTWVEVFSDGNLATDELRDIATDHNLICGSGLLAVLPNGTNVCCRDFAAIRFNH
jgi:hypothetical protein